MTRILRFGKRFALPALLAGLLLVVAQVVFASPPVASFTATVNPGAPGCGSVTFTDTSTDPESDIDTIQWDFGDGQTGSGSSVTHQYATAGPFTVNMTATDLDTAGDGVESNTATQSVSIPNTLPSATFTDTYSAAGATAGQTAFAATPIDDGTVTNYAWNFGDGTGTGQDASHAYTGHTPPTQNVTLTLTDNCQATGQVTRAVTLGNTAPAMTGAPTATVGSPPVAATAANPGTQVTFTAPAATDVNGDALTYTWDLDGDGAFDDGTGATVPHTYAATAPAAPAVRVQVTDGVTGSVAAASAALAFRVNKAPVVAVSNDPESPAVGEPVKFDASTSHDADASPGALTYAWDLDGDGQFDDSTLAAPTTHYDAIGNVNVGLRVTDGDGAATPFTKTITVQKTRPTARLTYSPANPVPGQAVTLTSTSTKSTSLGAPAITLTQWDFDYAATGAFGPVASGTTTRTSFSTAGVHTVAVRVTDGSNGTDIASAPIVVNARPKAAFTVRPTKPLEGNEIDFISTSRDPDGPIANQEWDLDDDGRYDDGTGVVASTRKLKKGTHQVRLRVTDSKGATATAAATVKVGAKPYGQPPDVTKTLGYARRSWGIQVVALYVSVPAHTTVKVTCKGRGCPHGTFVKRSKKRSTQLRFSKFRGLLRAGAKITVISSRNGSIAEYFTYTVRGNHREPLKRKRCKAPGAKKYRSCG
jgi:PKD repeat protein